MGVRFHELKTGDWFTFYGSDREYQYLGNGWYGRAYSGGPWHKSESDNPRVFLLTLEHAAAMDRWHDAITSEREVV